MFAVIGLGNPGRAYEKTRHNAGFWVVDWILAANEPSARWQSKFGCEYAKIAIGSESVLLIKPQKFMNVSGEAAQPLLAFFKVERENVIVLHDELDLTPGVIRVQRGGGAGGHRGVEDLVQHLGGSDFYRVRLGIGRPVDISDESNLDNITTSSGRDKISNWVLATPRPEEQELLMNAIQNSAKAVESLMKDGLERTQNRFNQTPKPKTN